MVMSAYIPTLEEMRGPYGQYQQQLRQGAPGLMGEVARYGSPYRVLEEAGMGGFAPRFSQYLLGSPEQNPAMWADWLNAPAQTNPLTGNALPAGGGFRVVPPGATTGAETWDVDPRWQDISAASRAMGRRVPESGDWTASYPTQEAWVTSPFAPYLGAMGDEGYTGARNLAQQALARGAMGGPTRGFLGGLANQRAGRYRSMFEREQLEDPTGLPEEAYLGWLSGQLPEWAPGYIPGPPR